MRVILIDQRASMEVAQAVAHGIARERGLSVAFAPEPMPKLAARADVPTYPVISLDHFIAKEGYFFTILFTKKILGILEKNPDVIVLDGSSELLPSIDVYEKRAWELPATITKALFWNRNLPAVLVHFCHPQMLQYYVREWSKHSQYSPIESAYFPDLPLPEIRVAKLIADTKARLAPYHPRARIRRAIISKLKRLKFW